MTRRSILRKPNSPSKGLHVRFNLVGTYTNPEAQRNSSSIIPDSERHPQANHQQWRARTSADIAAALTLLELSRGASSEAFALPAQSVQPEEVRRVTMYDCPGLNPIAPNSTLKRTWADMVDTPKELGTYAESKATSGLKNLVVKRTRDMEHVDEDEEQKGFASSEDESDVDYH